MTIFNPDIPSIQGPNTPNFNPGQQPKAPEADKSTGIALSTIGEGIEGIAKIADTAEKGYLKDQVETGVNTLRDSYLDALKGVRNMQLAGGDQTLLPDQGTPPPQSLQNGVQRIQALGQAQSQGSGKTNDTLYTGAIYSLAKQLRNQYPGYRDYIDEQIKSVSGIEPANAFMRNLLEDINKNTEANKTEVNATRTMLRGGVQEGMTDPGGVSAAQVLQLYDSGHLSIAQVNKWYNSAKGLDYSIKQKALMRADRQGDQADDVTAATKDLSQIASQTMAHNSLSLTLGKNTDTPQKLMAFLQSKAGSGEISDEQAQSTGQQLQAMRTATFQQLWKQAYEGGANSIATRMGGDTTKIKSTIDAQLAPFDTAIQDVFHKDWGSAYSHMNFNKAIASDTTNMLYNAPDEDVRKYSRSVAAINQISPQFGKDLFQQMLISDVPQKEKEWLKNQKMDLMVQPDANQGKLESVNSVIQEGKAKGATSPKTWKDLINTSNDINNPKLADPQRYNLARGFFDPILNRDLLSDQNFNKSGKYSVFTQLSSDNVSAGVMQLNKTHPDIGPMYRSMMEHEFGEQLWGKEIKDLGDIQDTGGFKVKYTDVQGRAPRFELLNSDGTPLKPGQNVNSFENKTVNRLNIGLAGLYNVYVSTGADPSSSIMQTMHTYGYNPQGVGEATWPGKFWNAITSSIDIRGKGK